MAGIGSNIFAGGSAQASITTDSDLSAQTYGPPAAGGSGPFSPRKGQGLGFWLATGGVIVLWLVRQSLPR